MNEPKRRKEDSMKKGGAKDRVKDKSIKNNSNDITWAEAAASVLERYDVPLPHKEILRIIQDEGLKGCGRGNMPLACLNSMLNSRSRGPNAIFYRAPGQQACFGLRKPKGTVKEETLTPINSVSATNDTITEPPVESLPSNDSNSKVSPESSPKSPKVTGSFQGNTGTVNALKTATSKFQPTTMTTRPRSTVSFVQKGPGKPGFPLSRAPGAALRVMPPKKRPKLDDNDDILKDEDSKDAKVIRTEVVVKGSPTLSSNRPAVDQKSCEPLVSQTPYPITAPLLTQSLQQPRRSRPSPSLPGHFEGRSTPSRYRQPASNLKQCNKPQLRVMPQKKATSPPPPINDSSDESPKSPAEEPKKTGPGFLEVKLKRLKKMSLAEQIKRLREGKVDIVTPDSILTSVNIKLLFNGKTFSQLPPAYQYQLLMLLPEVDRAVGSDNALRLSSSALNNEFFTQACQEWRDKLADGEFNVDIVQRIKQDEESGNQPKLDHWKEKYFEPAWGKRTLEDAVVMTKTQSSHKTQESAWSVFVKFAENSNEDFARDFKQMQNRVKAFRSENDRQSKADELKADLLHLARRSAFRRPSSPKSPKTQFKNEVVGKNRSKRALKRAQLLQRKKAFEKQLQEAKAKMVQNARMEARKSTTGPSADESSRTAFTGNEQDGVVTFDSREVTVDSAESKVTPLVIKRSGFHKSYRVIEKEDIVSSRKNNSQISEDCDVNGENECSASDVKILMEDAVKSAVSTAAGTALSANEAEAKGNDQTANTRTNKSTVNRSAKSNRDSRRRALTASNSGGKFKSSRVIRAASIYARASNSSCACSLAPMVICQKCGAFCHQDCINSNKICTLCIPA